MAGQARFFDVVQTLDVTDLVHMERVGELEIGRIGQAPGRETKLGMLRPERPKSMATHTAIVRHVHQGSVSPPMLVVARRASELLRGRR